MKRRAFLGTVASLPIISGIASAHPNDYPSLPDAEESDSWEEKSTTKRATSRALFGILHTKINRYDTVYQHTKSSDKIEETFGIPQHHYATRITLSELELSGYFNMFISSDDLVTQFSNQSIATMKQDLDADISMLDVNNRPDKADSVKEIVAEITLPEQTNIGGFDFESITVHQVFGVWKTTPHHALLFTYTYTNLPDEVAEELEIDLANINQEAIGFSDNVRYE